ncbi:DUF7288 family protein [Halostella salina]|uniref:DUF7288 family protein n=1 Tax=Halostella salina TaxID=1547897 RepID=UPI000EF7CFDF|nr:hypothetical protein [Halostella salina]
MFGDNRGQAFTLEGFIGSMLILTAVLFALQSIIITPTTSGTVDRDVQAGIEREAEDILAQEANNGTLKHQVLNMSDGVYGDSAATGYAPGDPPGGFGETLNATFVQRGRVYNVIVEFRDVDDADTNAGVDGRTRSMVYRGVPADSSVVATRTVTIYDDDIVPGTGDTVEESDDFPVGDTAPDSPVYTVAEVRIVVWG